MSGHAGGFWKARSTDSPQKCRMRRSAIRGGCVMLEPAAVWGTRWGAEGMSKARGGIVWGSREVRSYLRGDELFSRQKRASGLESLGFVMSRFCMRQHCALTVLPGASGCVVSPGRTAHGEARSEGAAPAAFRFSSSKAQ